MSSGDAVAAANRGKDTEGNGRAHPGVATRLKGMAMRAPTAETSKLKVGSGVNAMLIALCGVVRRLFRAPRRQTEQQDEMDVDDIDNLRAWSISAQLAAVPQAYETQVPQEVAALIRAARELHPEMARGARDRDERGEPCPSMG